MAWHRWVRSRKYPEVWTAVYRLYDAYGALLYVGIGSDYEVRWRSHAKEKPWWPQVTTKDITWYPSRLVAAYEEARAIREEAPRYNERAGIASFGVIVFEKRDRYGRWGKVADPELEVAAYDVEEALRLVHRNDAHIALVHEGEAAGIYVPWAWYQRACAAMGEPVAEVDGSH